MKTYIVGGAVRDRLLGRPVSDRDWVVVGATPEIMIARGFRPVGKDFPVFLHPDTGEEYALARTERKTARGYHGFSFNAAPDVTLEEDLTRRDLTINAMAEDEDGRIIDPLGGQADLARGLLRHVGPAFAEDPVRILRLARFAARFDFTVAPETMALMRGMTESGEVDALVAERVWQETVRALGEARPLRYFGILGECGARARILPELDRLAPEQETALQRACDAALPAEARFASLCHTLDDGALASLCERLRVPATHRDLARLVIGPGRQMAPVPDAATCHAILRSCDALRRPERFGLLLDVLLATRTLDAEQAGAWQAIRDAAAGVDAAGIARACPDPRDIPATVDAARTAAIAAITQPG